MKTFLEIHEKLLKEGMKHGLCFQELNGHNLDTNPIFSLFDPTNQEIRNHNVWEGHWGDSKDEINENNSDLLGTQYNEFRQNVILLCAAINGEL